MMQISFCAYTPRQNGVVEHKHRHLIEASCTLLIHAHVQQLHLETSCTLLIHAHADLSIALRKGIPTTRGTYLVYNF